MLVSLGLWKLPWRTLGSRSGFESHNRAKRERESILGTFFGNVDDYFLRAEFYPCATIARLHPIASDGGEMLLPNKKTLIRELRD